jgi:hypothetical protein
VRLVKLVQLQLGYNSYVISVVMSFYDISTSSEEWLLILFFNCGQDISL